ncbi:hypothetical protein Q1695_005802 [Nippostrongylus brasiliensis]|nr:hypothetical protein Q1695_005802 [Nippostrongylus brasiliensis]
MFWSVFCVLLLVNVLVTNVEARCYDAAGTTYCQGFQKAGGCDSGKACNIKIASTKCQRTCLYCKGF